MPCRSNPDEVVDSEVNCFVWCITTEYIVRALSLSAVRVPNAHRRASILEKIVAMFINMERVYRYRPKV